MKRSLTLIALLAVAGSVTAVVTASGQPAHASKARVIRVDAKFTAQHLVDAAPAGNSDGDNQLGSGLLRKAGTTKNVGRFVTSCINIPTNSGECTFTFALPGGKIAVLASYGKGFSGDVSAHDPIIGGTGAYASARGYIVDKETGEGKLSVVFHVTG